MNDEYEERDRQRGRAELFTEADCDTEGPKYDPQTGEYSHHVRAITPGKANRLLRERGTVVWGNVESGKPNWWGPHENNRFADTHTALIICIEKIEKPDTAEEILRDWLRWRENPLRYGAEGIQGVEIRARRLLGGGE